MKILVVDDIREFAFDAIYARTLEEAEELLSPRFHWDQVWLDNDLGPDSEVRTLTNKIEEMAHSAILLDVDEFVLHTSNVVARQAMFDALYRFYQVRIVDALEFLKSTIVASD